MTINKHESIPTTDEKITAIKDLLKDKNTIDQLDILSRADRILKDRAGRYYGGRLTDEEINSLDPPKIIKLKHKKDE